ncbi:MAG: proline dehydrogenase [Pseudopedobacter saltans]|uniref:Proline dehydrogenase n=1 Tax=Pseudopedobacter saltans TaxID=151895 RepID=A0A2W5GTN3_9SPHI|nr:MAG: proline dehydrogenase [Pseudopedobacter saltans]
MSLSFENTEVAFQYRNNKQLKKAHFLFKSMGSSFLTKTGIKLTDFALKFHLPIKGLIKSTIFEQFCGGEDIQEAGKTSSILGKYNVTVALDYGVEGKESEEDYDRAVPEFVRAIEFAAVQHNIPFIPIKITGFASFGLLEKLNDNKEISPDELDAWKRVGKRIDTICAVAAKNKIRILIDAEETWIQKPIDDLTNLMMERYNKEECYIFNTFQQYCVHRLDDMKRDFELAVAKGYHFGAKIVRGAYMEKERARAIEKGYPSPINPTKEATDQKYNEALDFCLEHLGPLTLYMGTHNEDSCMKAVHALEGKGIAPANPYVYFAQLYGMSDNMTFNLANAGYHANKYLPYGPVEDVIPYLMRRAQENTSVKGQTGRELFLIQKEMKRRGI